MPKFSLTLLTACLAMATLAAQTPTPRPGQTPPVRQTPTPTPTPKSGSDKPSGMPTSGTAFVKAAMQGGLAEVEMAKVALSKTSRDDVKALAQMIEEDHQQANAELKTLADDKHWTLPTAVSASQKATADGLNTLSGAAFDRAYVDDMVKDHQHDVAEFKKHENDADADVREFAAKARPTLEKHLAKAEEVQKAIRGTSR